MVPDAASAPPWRITPSSPLQEHSAVEAGWGHHRRNPSSANKGLFPSSSGPGTSRTLEEDGSRSVQGQLHPSSCEMSPPLLTVTPFLASGRGAQRKGASSWADWFRQPSVNFQGQPNQPPPLTPPGLGKECQQPSPPPFSCGATGPPPPFCRPVPSRPTMGRRRPPATGLLAQEH
jgi:hypothetical protein